MIVIAALVFALALSLGVAAWILARLVSVVGLRDSA
jgi:hypothetical protein